MSRVLISSHTHTRTHTHTHTHILGKFAKKFGKGALKLGTGWWGDFKEFMSQDEVMNLAVGVIIGSMCTHTTRTQAHTSTHIQNEHTHVHTTNHEHMCTCKHDKTHICTPVHARSAHSHIRTHTHNTRSRPFCSLTNAHIYIHTHAAAFGQVVTSLVQDVLMPPLGMLSESNWDNWFFVIRDGHTNSTCM